MQELREAFEQTSLSGMFPLNLSHKGSGNSKEKETERVRIKRDRGNQESKML